MKILLFLSLFCGHLAKAELYIDHVTEKGKQYIVIEKNKAITKVEVSAKDDEATQIAKVCEVINCNGKQ